MDLAQKHSEITSRFMSESILDLLNEGGSYPDVMVVLESVILGVMLLNVKAFNLSPKVSSGLAEAAMQRAIERFTEAKL